MPSDLVSLRSANLNLVPILRALLRESSVSRAAVTLGMSQSAASGALASLRLLLNDPLLVQVGRGMQLTPRAQQLMAPLERLCGDLASLLQDAPFDPGVSERTFVIAAPDYVSFVIGSALIRALQRMAPNVTVQFIDLPSDYAARLASGDIDIIIIAKIAEEATTGLSSGPALEDRMVWLVRSDHPMAVLSAPTATDIERFPCACFSPGLDKDWRGAMRRNGFINRGRPTVMLQQFAVMPTLALESDCVVMVPKTLADRMNRQGGLKMFETSEDVAPIPTSVFWSPTHDADPAHRWFRELASGALHGLDPV